MKKLILLIPFILFASLNVYVNKQKVYPGEEVVYTIEATGSDIKFPNIKNIGGFQVQGSSVAQNITILNGNMQKKISKSYIFFPTKSVKIPSFSVKIDGKEFKTREIEINVTKPSQSRDKNFKIELNISKKDVYLEEPVVFTLKFYQNEHTNPQSIEIQKPNFKNFLTKLISKKEYKAKNFSVTEYSFLLIPQKTGSYKIGPILAKIGYLTKQNPFNDPFFNMFSSSLKYKNIFSNSIKINVKPIPSNTVYGTFKASLSADKTQANANEPVKISLNISGCGDFYDLPDFKLDVKNATLYENTPKIKTDIQNGKLCGSYTKEFTVISDSSFSVPAVSFKSFENKKINEIKSNSLFINVKNSSPHKHNISKITGQTKEKIIYKTKTDYLLLAVVFISGAITGILVLQLVRIRRQNTPDIIREIKKASDKELFNLLLEYSYHPQIEETLKKLEENIYSGKNNKINKKEIIKIIKKLKA